MSFGYSVSDIFTVILFAWKIYNSCTSASDDFKDVSREVATLHLLLKETERYLSNQNGELNSDWEARIRNLEDGCKEILADLEKILEKYKSLGKSSKKLKDKVRFALLEDIKSIRGRLMSCIATVTAFNSSIAR